MHLFPARVLALTLLTGLLVAGGAVGARAELLIKVDQSIQRMSVDLDGRRLYDWPVSTGRPGYDTPTGAFKPNRMDADHYSQEYDNAPMPYAIFFDLNGHAIHGSFDPIGKPAASHGCVRLAPANAAKLFALVREQKMANTRVEISGDVRVALRNLKGAKTATARTRRAPADIDEDADYGQAYPTQFYYQNAPSQLGVYGLY